MSGSKLFVSRLVAKGSVPLYYISCRDLEGRDCYYYLTSTPEKMRMYEKVRHSSFDLNDFGSIIASGYGTEPSEEIRRMLEEKYGVK